MIKVQKVEYPKINPYHLILAISTANDLSRSRRATGHRCGFGISASDGEVILPQRRLAILTGQAKRLALNPPDSAWTRRMVAQRRGLAAQEKYRREEINPTAKTMAGAAQ